MADKQAQYIAKAKGHYNTGASMLLSIMLIVSIAPSINTSHEPVGTSSSSSCEPSKTVPNRDELLKQSKNISTSDFSSLANMIGYVYLYDQGFIPLVLKKLDVDDKSVRLKSDCATLVWTYGETNSKPLPLINLMALNLLLPDANDFSTDGVATKSICQFHRMWTLYHSNFRFSCKNRMSMICREPQDDYGYMRPVAEVVLLWHEFEVSGDADEIKKGEFSTIPYKESCETLVD